METQNESVPQPEQFPKEFVALVGDGVSYGAMVAVGKFISHHSAKKGTEEIEMATAAEFIVRLSSEFMGGKDYPFPEGVSYKELINKTVDSMSGVLFALFKNGETDVLASLCRTVGLGETLKFLEANKFDAMKAVTAIRIEKETPPLEVDLPPENKVEITD